MEALREFGQSSTIPAKTNINKTIMYLYFEKNKYKEVEEYFKTTRELSRERLRREVAVRGWLGPRVSYIKLWAAVRCCIISYFD